MLQLFLFVVSGSGVFTSDDGSRGSFALVLSRDCGIASHRRIGGLTVAAFPNVSFAYCKPAP